jgi:hypothetical protein
MKRIILFSVVCFAFSVHNYLLAGNTITRYYTQLKIVAKNGQEQKCDSSGQFITFNDKGCYDSDKNGYTVKNGFLKFGKASGDRVYYSGSSYWGETTYIFTQNYGRLNIRVEADGTTYVYVLATPPKNVETCALIKEKQESSTTQTAIIANSHTTPNNGNITTNQSSSTTKRDEYGYVSCPQCHGSGKCSTCNGRGTVISTYTQEWDDCVNCSNGKCTKCGGSGQVYRKIR